MRSPPGLGVPESSTAWRAAGLSGVEPTEYAMLWNPGGQLMAVGDSAFVHDGSINTAPSHDLAHLLVAANNRKLAWKPVGLQKDICFAEYNAVCFEHTLDRIYRAYVDKTSPTSGVVSGLVAHLQWFVEKHFTPFPCGTKEALRLYLVSLSDESAIRLCPYFFQMKSGERADLEYMRGTWSAKFRAEDAPPGWGDLQTVLRTQLALLRAYAASM